MSLSLSPETKSIWSIARNKNSGQAKSKSDASHIEHPRSSLGSVNKSIVPFPIPYKTEEKQFARLIDKMKGGGYELDLTQHYTRKRVKLVLDWSVRNINQTRRLSKPALFKVFGNSTNELSQYLRDMLLVKEQGHSRSQAKSAKWTVNQKAIHNLWFLFYNQELDMKTEQLKSWAALAKAQGFSFEYTEPTIGGRRYNELQIMPKEIKKQIYKGYWDYDLSASNVTLIKQTAQMAAHDNGWEFETPRINWYLANKGAFRIAVAKTFKITLPEAKEIMQCIFSLAYFEGNDNSHAFQILGKKSLEQFMDHPMLQELRTEMIECWKILMGKDWTNGEKRFRLYEQLERQIIDAVEAQLKGKRYLLQHDGFLLLERDELDLVDLISQVKARTGLDVSLDVVQL